MRAKGGTLVELVIVLALGALLIGGVQLTFYRVPAIQRDYERLEGWIKERCVAADSTGLRTYFLFYDSKSAGDAGHITASGALRSKFRPKKARLYSSTSHCTYQPGANTFSPSTRVWLTDGKYRWELILSGRGLVRRGDSSRR